MTDTTKENHKGRWAKVYNHDYFLNNTDGVFDIVDLDSYRGFKEKTLFRCTICGSQVMISWQNLQRRISKMRKAGRPPKDYCYKEARPRKVSSYSKKYSYNFALEVEKLTKGELRLYPDTQVFKSLLDKYDFRCTICQKNRRATLKSIRNSVKNGHKLCNHSYTNNGVTEQLGLTRMTTEQWVNELQTLTNGVLVPKFYQPYMGVVTSYWFTCTQCGRDQYTMYKAVKSKMQRGSQACKHKYYLQGRSSRPGELKIDVEDLTRGYITTDPNALYIDKQTKYTYRCNTCGVLYTSSLVSLELNSKSFDPDNNSDPYYPCNHFHPRVKTH